MRILAAVTILFLSSLAPVAAPADVTEQPASPVQQVQDRARTPLYDIAEKTSQAVDVWQRIHNYFSSRGLSGGIGMHKQVLGISDGHVVAQRWIDFRFSINLLHRNTAAPAMNEQFAVPPR